MVSHDFGQLKLTISIDATKNSVNISKQTVSFDGLAQPFVQTFQYDQLYRLKEAKETNNGNQTWRDVFDYDRYGNRNFVTGRGQTSTLGTCPSTVCNPSINPNTNKLNSTGYSFDASGNTTADAESRVFIYS